MTVQPIQARGYLPGYGNDSIYRFTKLFSKKINICFDVLEPDPQADYNVLVQCEPPELYHAFAGRVESTHAQYDLILTYHDRLLALPNAEEFCPVGSWIDPGIVLDKQNEISYIMSSKIYTNAQRIRFMIMRRYQHVKNIGPFNFRMHRSPPRLPSKNDFFSWAKFNIACENQIMPNMYTEKILDCFQTRTVPIYFGCTNLHKYFDERGIIRFWGIEELEHILNTLTPEDYESRKPYIDRNYELARPFWESTVHERIENIITQKIGV